MQPQQPPTLNFLSPTGFKFSINKIPNVNFLVQATEIPQVAMNSAEMATPFVKIPFPGDHIQYSPLSIVFKVDENLTNYMELYRWFKALGFPSNFAESREVYNLNSLNQLTQSSQGKGVFSDGVLTILNSSMNPCAKVTYYDMFPIGISQLSFDSRVTDIKYIDVTATFVYRSFDIESLVDTTVWGQGP